LPLAVNVLLDISSCAPSWRLARVNHHEQKRRGDIFQFGGNSYRACGASARLENMRLGLIAQVSCGKMQRTRISQNFAVL